MKKNTNNIVTIDVADIIKLINSAESFTLNAEVHPVVKYTLKKGNLIQRTIAWVKGLFK